MIFPEDFIEPRCVFMRVLSSVTESELVKLAAELSGHRIHTAILNGTLMVSQQTAGAELAAQLRFPAYAGTNWDALNDSLGDLSWLEGAAGYVLAIRDAAAFLRNAPEVAAQVIEICGYAAEFWRKQGRPFRLLLLF